MWRSIIAIGLVFTLSACGQTEHKISRQDARQLLASAVSGRYEVDGEPFTGVLVANYDNDQRAIEIGVEDGLPSGHLRRWAENGQKVLDAEAYIGENGRREPVKYETWAPNGTQTELRNYNDDHELVEYKRWHSDGTLVAHEKYAGDSQPVFKKTWRGDGSPEKSVAYDDDGHVTLAKFWCNKDQLRQKRRSGKDKPTVITHWNCANGDKISEKQYAAGQSEYAEDAQRSSPNGFRYGLTPDGLEQTWWDNGKPKMRARYADGKKDGAEETFYFDGKKKTLAHWKNGQGVGDFREWYAGGQPKTQGGYNQAGKKTGLWKHWSKDGDQSVEDYQRDIYVKSKYLRPFGQALTGNRRDFSPDKAMYYVNNGLVKANAKLPALSNASSINYYAANRWPKSDWTYPIIVANKALIKPLLAAGADINAQDSAGRTRLLICASQLAGRYCGIAEFKTMLDNGAKVSVTDAIGRTALHYVAAASTSSRNQQAEQDAAVKALLAAGVPVNAQDKDGNTALMYALAHRRDDLATRLLDAGAKVDLENNQQRQAIHYVFLTGPRRYSIRDDDFTRTMLKQLTGAGADINAKMNWNDQPITLHEMAVQQGMIKLAQYMETLGAKKPDLAHR